MRRIVAALLAVVALGPVGVTPAIGADGEPLVPPCKEFVPGAIVCQVGSVAVPVVRGWRTMTPPGGLHVIGDGLGGLPIMDGDLSPLQVGVATTVRVEASATKSALADRELLSTSPWKPVFSMDQPVDGTGHRLEVVLHKGERTAFYTKSFFDTPAGTVEVAGWVVSSSGGARSTELCGIRGLLRGLIGAAAPSIDQVDAAAVERAIKDYDMRLPQAIMAVQGSTDKMSRGDYAGAVDDLTGALEVCEGLASAQNNLAWALLHTDPPKLDDALRHARRADELTGHADPSVLDTLMTALDRRGEPDEAAAVQVHCRQIAPAYPGCRREPAASE